MSHEKPMSYSYDRFLSKHLTVRAAGTLQKDLMLTGMASDHLPIAGRFLLKNDNVAGKVENWTPVGNDQSNITKSLSAEIAHFPIESKSKLDLIGGSKEFLQFIRALS